MIHAEASYIDQSHLRLVFVWPDGQTRDSVVVNDKKEAFRLVYFHNRLYIVVTLRMWLNGRMNVYQHVGDFQRVNEAVQLIHFLDDHCKTSLKFVTRSICDREAIIRHLAPGEKSKYYKTFESVIVPILIFCCEMQGTEQPC